jgi:hypothetical protein
VTPTLMRRTALFTVLSVIAALLVAMMAGPALGQSAQLPDATASPVPSPSSTLDALGDFTHVPGTGAPSDLDWQPVTEPTLEAGASLFHLTAWDGGFAVIEQRRDPDHGWRHAIWWSPDGRTWERTPLPTKVRQIWWLLPFRDGLVLASGRHRGYSSESFRLDIWRSPDGRSWRHAGAIGASLPLRLKRERFWHLWPAELLATEEGLTLLARVTYSQGTGGSTRDVTQFVSNRGPMRVRASPHPDRVWGWRSRDGSRWHRRPVRGVVAPNGNGSIDLATITPDSILARQVDGTRLLLSSRGGLRWTIVAPLLLSDNGEEEGSESCGNRLGAWRLGPGEVWTEVLDRQPAFVHGAAADGGWVILTGKSWCAGEWAWILVSADGGRTWDPDLSWTGRRGTCRSEAAVHGGTAVVLACTRDRSRTTADDPPMWWAQLPPLSA